MPVRTPAPRMIARLALVLSLPLVAGALSACTKLTEADVTPNRYGSVSIRARNGAANQATANATAIFFEAIQANLPASVDNRGDQCVFAQLDTNAQFTTGLNQAGAQVTLNYGTSSVVLPYETSNKRYANPETSPFTYASGDIMTVTVPGDANTFPASTISVPLAQPIIPGVISVPTGTAPMVFTWNASADTTTSIILSLRYANPANSTYANEQIYCALRDDGTHQIATSALAAFLASPNSKRSLVMTRWRTRVANLGNLAYLHVASSIDTTVTFQP